MNRIIVGVAAVALFAASGSVAYAHGGYQRSAPADGEIVMSAPAEVWAEFTEPPNQTSGESKLKVFNQCGEQVDDGRTRFGLTNRMTVGIKAGTSAPGAWRVDWFLQSLTDGHLTKGSWSFTVTGSPASCGGGPGTPTPPASSSKPTGRPAASPTPTITPSPVPRSSGVLSAPRAAGRVDAPPTASPPPFSTPSGGGGDSGFPVAAALALGISVVAAGGLIAWSRLNQRE